MKHVAYCLLFVILFACDSKSQEVELSEKMDISYYQGSQRDSVKHALNLVLPAVDDAPMLIWLHGGAWAFGDRSQEMDFARKVAGQGIAVAVVSYRLSPALYSNPPKSTGVQHPEHIEDVAKAFKWVYDHADEYGYNKSKIYISGYSAGAHLAALLSMDNRYLKKVELDKRVIAGCIPISGTFDIPDYYNIIERAYGRTFAKQHVNGVFGNEDTFLGASPVNYLEGLTTPMLVIADGALAMYSQTFEKALKTADRDDIPFKYYYQFDHAELAEDLSHNEHSEARNDLIEFIHGHS